MAGAVDSLTDGGRGVVLFTGFPGFIGARLLPKLLERRPDWSFCCLVQERFRPLAEEAIRDLSAAHPHVAGRIATVTGDITQPGLGLEPSVARDVAPRIVAAYHLAAVYDLAVGRRLAETVNVEGTRNVLRFLAGAPRLERHHYVSTAYVSGRSTGVFRETDLDVGQSFKNHYEETKFLAEVEVARSGLPTTTYRPGVVVGDSRTGETGKFDGPYFILSAMEKLPSPGVFLKVGAGRGPVGLVPVDYVVEAMAALAAHGPASGRTYHLTDPHPLNALEVAEHFAHALGKRFAYLPVPLPVARALLSPGPVRRWLGMPVETLDYFDHPCVHDTTQATTDLLPLGVRCPSLPEYVDRLVAFYREKAGRVRREAMV